MAPSNPQILPLFHQQRILEEEQSAVRESISGRDLYSVAWARWKLSISALTWKRKTKKQCSLSLHLNLLVMFQRLSPKTLNQLSLLGSSLPPCHTSSPYLGNLRLLRNNTTPQKMSKVFENKDLLEVIMTQIS